jgi:tetratricopeptide (TPR) repeat protein
MNVRQVLLAAVLGAAAYAQGPGRGQPLLDMQAIANALGVSCEYCHSARGSSQPEPKKDIARQMIAMTRELNARIEAATMKPAGEAVRVDCITCHHGVPVPRQLTDIVWQTTIQQGGEAAVAQYRDLRARFHGRAAYDFGENTLITVSRRVANARPDDAIALAKLNLEFFPNSAASWEALAFAYTRKVDDESAIAALEKAVELDPANSVARGQLEQLKSYRRRR